MAESSVRGAIRCKPSGDRPNRTEGNRPPPPLSPRDLISALPDAVIHHIFSFLPLRDVVRTSVLSKRWRSTWTSTTHLVFHVLHRVRRRNDTCSFDFPSLVDSVLLRCTSPTVKRFHVIGIKGNCPKLDYWFRFAEARRVEDLLLWVTDMSPFLCTLPGFLNCLSWLVRLEVRMCCFSLSTTIRWPCLKVLVIIFADMSDDILEGIVRGSPVLESLELHMCKGVKNILIHSTSVKELVLVQNIGPHFNTEKLWAPHLLSLRLSGYWPHDSMFRLDNISSLVEAKLDFHVSCNKRMPCDFLKELFEKLCGVPTITISTHGNWCLQEMEGVPSPLLKCQTLTLHAPVSQWDLPGMAYLLRSSQCLEKLVIHLTGFPQLKLVLDEESKECFNFDEEDFLCSRKGSFECLAKHLKRVEIVGYKANSFGSKHLLALIKFLLRDALLLEKLIIKAKLPTRPGKKRLQAAVLSKLLGVSKNVLSCRRASKNAEVIFDYPFE